MVAGSNTSRGAPTRKQFLEASVLAATLLLGGTCRGQTLAGVNVYDSRSANVYGHADYGYSEYGCFHGWYGHLWVKLCSNDPLVAALRRVRPRHVPPPAFR